MKDVEFEAAIEQMYVDIGTVSKLRSDLAVQNLLKAVRKSKRFQVDVEALSEEIQQANGEVSYEEFALHGTDGLKEANTARARIRGARTQLVTMNKRLRETLGAARRGFRIGCGWLRTKEETAGLAAKAFEETAALVLRELHDVMEDAKRLMEETQEVLVNLDASAKEVDAWFALHKQYIFVTLNRGPRDDEEKEPAPRKLGSQGGSRRAPTAVDDE